jgi:hypothetical protein
MQEQLPRELGGEDYAEEADNSSNANQAAGVFNGLNRFTLDVSKALNIFFFFV